MLQISSFLRAEIVSSIAASAPRLCDERYLHEDDRTPVGDEELPVLQGVRGHGELKARRPMNFGGSRGLHLQRADP